MRDNYYMVTFKFIENGRKCRTSWIGFATCPGAAERIASDWFGFEKDNIQVVDVKISYLSKLKKD